MAQTLERSEQLKLGPPTHIIIMKNKQPPHSLLFVYKEEPLPTLVNFMGGLFHIYLLVKRYAMRPFGLLALKLIDLSLFLNVLM